MEADAGTGEVKPSVQTLPLNSRRLTAARLRQLARGMNLPTTASTEDLKLIIDGKVTELGHEPRNVQVQLHPDRLELLDFEGPFLNVSTLGGNPGSGYGEEADSVPSLSDAESEDGHEEVDELREQVAILTAERTEQANTIQALQEQLEEAKQRMRTLWRTSCTQLEECDRTLVETDASIQGLGAILSQKDVDGRQHPIAYASRALASCEKNYAVTELETLAVVWGLKHFKFYLYGHNVTVLTDHSAVKAVLETSSLTGKHARWWMQVYGSGMKNVNITYRSGKTNVAADALSRNPVAFTKESGDSEEELNISAMLYPNCPEEEEEVAQVAQVESQDSDELNISSMLMSIPGPSDVSEAPTFEQEQLADTWTASMMEFLKTGKLPADDVTARRIAAQSVHFSIVEGILYYLDPRCKNQKRAVVPAHLRQSLLQENHRGLCGGHFATKRLYSTLIRHWWWEGMYADTHTFVKNCPECVVVTGGAKPAHPTLHPIPVQRPFQIIGVDIMELPLTKKGNKYVVVFQDFFSKWPMVFPTPDQKALRLAKLLVEEVVPFCGVPEALLSDRGANLLSCLVRDVCKLLGTKKLNTTSYHPQCDGMVERFNRTLKTAIRKYAAAFGDQWDTYLSGILWAYRNSRHDSTGEKPSFLLFGFDCRSPSEAALFPTTPIQPADITDYREQLMLSLSEARSEAAKAICKAQQTYKKQYDKKAKDTSLHVGDWVMVKFPQDNTGKRRKLSRPWHGPYRILCCNDPDVTVTKIYFPEHGSIRVHQSRITPCPSHFPSGWYWYGLKRHSPGRPPKWLSSIGITPKDTPPDPDTSQQPDTTQDPNQEDGSEGATLSGGSDSPEDSSEGSDLDRDSLEVSTEERYPTHETKYSLRSRVRRPQRLIDTLGTS